MKRKVCILVCCLVLFVFSFLSRAYADDSWLQGMTWQQLDGVSDQTAQNWNWLFGTPEQFNQSWEQMYGTPFPFHRTVQPAPQILPFILIKNWDIITLSNGTQWQIAPLDVLQTSSWIPSNKIIVVQNNDSLAFLYPCSLVDTNAVGIDRVARASYLGTVNLNQ